MLELLTRPLPPREHAPRAINLVPGLPLSWSGRRLPSSARPLSSPAPLEVDGVTVVYCQTYAEAEACIREMIADAGGKPVALDLETCPVESERARLAALLEEREAVNAEAIAFRKAAKKAKTPQAEIDAFTAEADAKLKALDSQIDHAESAGLDPHRSEIQLVQLYGGKARVAVVDLAKAGPEALELLRNVDTVIHGAFSTSATLPIVASI